MMTDDIDIQQYSDANANCIFDANCFSEEEMMVILENDAQLLFKHAELIFETHNAASYRVKINDTYYFAKRFKFSKSYKYFVNLFIPTCKSCFESAIELLKVGIHTPKPIAAAVYGKKKHQVLITEFIDEAYGLDSYIENCDETLRPVIFEELAMELATFYRKGFYSRHLRSANIMVFKEDNKRIYTFIDLDKLGRNRLFGNRAYISTVSRACFEFFDCLNNQEKQLLLRKCFDAAMKQNIYYKPSQMDSFVNKVIAQIKKRRWFSV